MSFEQAVHDEIKRLKERIAALTSVIGSGNPPQKARRIRKATSRKPKAGTPKRILSPKIRAQRVLQGRYMGHVRRLTADQKTKISAIREKAGYSKAIAAAKKLAK